MARELFDGRLVVSPTMGLIALGDIILIALFISLGELRHGVSPLMGLDTIGQFLAGWFIVAPIAGVYGTKMFSSPRSAAIRLVIAWIPANVLGVFIRATTEAGATMAITFILVTLAVGLAFLLPWRVAVAWYLRRINSPLVTGRRRSVL